jgi:hypothetical protein
VNIPIDFTNASRTKSSSNQQDSNLNNNNNRTYGLQVNSNENPVHHFEPHHQQRPTSSYSKRTEPDIPITTRPSTAKSTDRTVNELRVNLSSPPSYLQQQSPLQIDEKNPQQRITSKQLHTTLNQAPKQSHYEDHSWITDDQRRPIITSPPPPQLSTTNNGRNTNDRRSASLTSHHQDLQMDRQAPNQLTMFHYGDHTDASHHHHHHHSRNTQPQREFDPSMDRHHQSKHRVLALVLYRSSCDCFFLSRKSPIRTTINTNNNRVLSVSGKLRCSKCNDELGKTKNSLFSLSIGFV